MARAKVSGTIIGVSNPKVFNVEKKKRVDYFHLTLKDLIGRKILIYISAVSLGLFSEAQSKVYFTDRKSGRILKHRMATPSRLLNQKVVVEGDMTIQKDGYYMTYISSLKLI